MGYNRSNDPGLNLDLNILLQKQFRDLRQMMCCKLTEIANGSGIVSNSIMFTIGDGHAGTPLVGTTTYTNTVLNNKTLLILKNGVGFLTAGVDFNSLTGGGFVLIGGELFNTGETYTILY